MSSDLKPAQATPHLPRTTSYTESLSPLIGGPSVAPSVTDASSVAYASSAADDTASTLGAPSVLEAATPAQAAATPQKPTRELQIVAKRFGSSGSRIVDANTKEPLYYLSKPWGITKPSIQLHKGADTSAPVVACARVSAYQVGLEIMYGDGTSKGRGKWSPLEGGIMELGTTQRFSIHEDLYVWSWARTVVGDKVKLSPTCLELRTSKTGGVVATWQRKSTNRNGDRGTLTIQADLDDEAEAMTVLTAMTFDDTRGHARMINADMAGAVDNDVLVANGLRVSSYA